MAEPYGDGSGWTTADFLDMMFIVTTNVRSFQGVTAATSSAAGRGAIGACSCCSSIQLRGHKHCPALRATLVGTPASTSDQIPQPLDDPWRIVRLQSLGSAQTFSVVR